MFERKQSLLDDSGNRDEMMSTEENTVATRPAAYKVDDNIESPVNTDLSSIVSRKPNRTIIQPQQVRPQR